MNSKDISDASHKAISKGAHLFRRIGSWFTENWRRFQRGITSYLRSKARNFPTVLPQPRRKVVEEIVKGEVFLDSIDRFARETGFSVEEVRDKAKAYVKEIASDLNYLTFPLWDFVLSWVFNKLYDGLVIDEESLQKIKEQVGQAPIVFVPNHRSHIDYMLLSYVFYCRQLPMPYVCAGSNMNFWPFGSFFRKSGAYFIRRTFEGNRLYQAALYAYMHYLLKEKALMEFFIEGTRSRTGKLLSPRLGILSLLVRAYKEQDDIKDIVFVPTSVVYESVIEETIYSKEMEGVTKQKEGFMDVLRVGKYLRGRYGKVYIRFGEPLSVDEFPKPQSEEEEKTFVPRLANEIGYTINRHTVVTPTSLLTMSLLSHPTPVITVDELEKRFSSYLDYLKFKQAPVSDLVLHHQRESIQSAVQKLIRFRLIRRYEDSEGIFYRIPTSRRRRLEFYKNMGVHFFISASAVANIFLSEQDCVLSREQIEKEFVFLRDLFADEFRFGTRKSPAEHIQPVLDFFERQEALQKQGDSNYQVIDKNGCLTEFAALLDSTISFYWGVFSVLAILPEKQWLATELNRRLLENIRLKLLRNNVMRQEALSTFAIRNALLTANRFQIVEASKAFEGKRSRQYYHTRRNPKSLQDLLQRLERYRG